MTHTQRHNDAESAALLRTRHTSGQASESVYTYESAGIAERKGNVPIWLWVVVVSLLLWGLYYLVAYWNAPAPPM
jgi:cytochrome c-type biogenesis protein CcmH/NrfG